MSALVLTVLMHMSACGPTEPVNVRQPPRAAEGKQRGALEEAALVLDVRTDEEYAAGHVPGARHVPIAEFAARIAEVEAAVPDKRSKIVVYGQSDRRAGQATALLEKRGFEDVFNAGGYADLK